MSDDEDQKLRATTSQTAKSIAVTTIPYLGWIAPLKSTSSPELPKSIARRRTIPMSSISGRASTSRDVD